MKKVLSLLTALLICFGITACNSDKECNCNCNEQQQGQTNNQGNDNQTLTAIYEDIGHKRVSVSLEDHTYIYTFEVAICNPTSDTININPSKFTIKGTRVYTKTDDTRYSQSFGVTFKVYSDETKHQEVTDEWTVQTGRITTVYIETEVLHKDIPAYGVIKYDELSSIELRHDGNLIIFISA